MNKAALLIGVSEYDSESGLKSLPSAAEDVQAMQRILLQSSEFTAENITVLTNPQKHDLEEAIYQLFTDRQKEDLLLFYFSGHGIKDETGKLYFSLPTTRKNQNGSLIKHTAIPANVLHESMNDSRSTCQVLVLDCCFSGAFAKGLTVKDDGNIDICAQLGGKGRAIFTSSNSIEYSFHQDSLRLSVYTHFFVEGLEKGAADLDGDGLISADELHIFVSDKVRQIAPKMTPQFFPVEQGHKIYLARAVKVTSVNVYALINQAKESELEEEYESAKELWWQVIDKSQSSNQRQEARSAIERIERRIKQLDANRLASVPIVPQVSKRAELLPTSINGSTPQNRVKLLYYPNEHGILKTNAHASGRITILGPRPSGKITFLTTLAYFTNINNMGDPIDNNAETLIAYAENILKEGSTLAPPSLEIIDDTFSMRLTLKSNSFNAIQIPTNLILDCIFRIAPGEFFDALSNKTDALYYFEDFINACSESKLALIIDSRAFGSDQQYAVALKSLEKRLHDRLNDLQRREYRIAVMFSCFDQPEVWNYRNNPDAFAKLKFSQTQSALQKWNNKWNCSIAYFTFSSFGMINSSDIANATSIIDVNKFQALKQTNNWQPFGLIEPICWLLATEDSIITGHKIFEIKKVINRLRAVGRLLSKVFEI